MTTLRIRYLASEQRAELSVADPSPAWDAIRRTCEERSDEVLNESATRLTLPWWAFLSLREALRVQLQRFQVGLDPDGPARDLLTRARQRQENYSQALTAQPLPEAAIEPTLAQKGFVRPDGLKPFQRRNIAALARFPAAATFSVPGAGKTTEALAYFFLKREPNSRLLVIAPKNAFGAWEEQLELCAPHSGLQFVRLRGGAVTVQRLLEDDPEMMLITYQQLPTVQGLIADYIARHPTFVFIDESHRMKKGNAGIIGTAILNLSHLPTGKLIMSGTPMPNALSDLVPQFDFLYPEVRATEADVRGRIQPVYVRTTKPELGLEPPRRVAIHVLMKPGQRHLYELVRSEEARQLSGLRSADTLRLRQIGRSATRLLQLTSNPALLAGERFEHDNLLREVLAEGDSPKIEYVCRRVRQLAAEGKKTVVWSGFVENVELIARRLADLGADYIHGGVDAGSEENSDTREAKIRRFHDDDDAFVLVGNPAACSEGISLHTVCHNAIYLDRNYNAAQYLQSEDRIHRLGLPPGTNTLIEIVVCPDTVDDSVQRRLNSKIDEMATVLNDRSILIEPVTIDPDDPNLSEQDVEDFVRHLLGR